MPPITLPERCDRTIVIALHSEFLAATGAEPLQIDATKVTYAGEALLQFLLSAKRTGEGAIIDPSPALLDAARMAGVAHELFDGMEP